MRASECLSVGIFQQTRSAVMRNRVSVGAALTRLGFDVLPSSIANFILARHPGHSGQALTAELRDRAVLVRHFAAPRISDFLRPSLAWRRNLSGSTRAVSEVFTNPSRRWHR
jgi:histidinol-phosphate aminotransferase